MPVKRRLVGAPNGISALVDPGVPVSMLAASGALPGGYSTSELATAVHSAWVGAGDADTMLSATWSAPAVRSSWTRSAVASTPPQTTRASTRASPGGDVVRVEPHAPEAGLVGGDLAEKAERTASNGAGAVWIGLHHDELLDSEHRAWPERRSRPLGVRGRDQHGEGAGGAVTG